MLWVILVILGIVLIVSISKGNKKKNLEIEKLQREKWQKQKLEREAKENAAKQTSVSDELTKLKKLLDDGILTQDEFEKQKSKLLS
ncbi:SHOCT domain-containing protein [uncultured Draconibacterium sp.]|uniref:SHOCT domain-containing protein n=1 Tax=uncultured Draconibacterium sp. TaxID=1573823 RepID=UPI0025F03B6D|nr:SHOCT domain-containing protein [uncultured Draconibacterium sp.]